MWQRPSWKVFRDLAAWPVESQVQSRRNALVASTELATRRRDRLEVEEFLARLQEPIALADPAAPGPYGRTAVGDGEARTSQSRNIRT